MTTRRSEKYGDHCFGLVLIIISADTLSDFISSEAKPVLAMDNYYLRARTHTQCVRVCMFVHVKEISGHECRLM